MPFCSNCGNEFKDEERFCSSCGEALPTASFKTVIPKSETPKKTKQASSKLVKHLLTDEKVLWSSKPSVLRFLFNRFVWSLLTGILFIAVLNAILSITGSPSFINGLDIILVFIGVLITTGPLIIQIIIYYNRLYTVTENRMIIQTGVIGLDTRFIELDKIQEVYVNIGPIDRLCGTGTIIAMTAAYLPLRTIGYRNNVTRPAFESIRTPYRVEKIIRGAIEKKRQVRP